MKKILLAFSIIYLGLTGVSNAQFDTYFSASSEMIFSFATTEYVSPETGATYESGNIVRWSPFFNYQGLINADFARPVGMFLGVSIRNVGFIYSYPETSIKKKFRTYNVGFPIGFKLGNMKGFFVYGGYEIEFPVNYKEKTFINEVKEEKFNVWFSDRVEKLQHSFLLGLNMPYGFNIKFKYYITNFHNQEFTETDLDGNILLPYEGLKSNIFYISLNFGLFEPARNYYNPQKWSEVY